MAGLCSARGMAHATLTVDLVGGAGVSARARTARYGALGDWAKARGLAAIITAHHADDQAETLVMRLNRGAGVRGLAGMRPQAVVPGHPDLPLLRPLLAERRADLAALVAEAGLAAIDDPTNRDARFERARVRAGLAGADWLDPPALARSAAHLADADEAIAWMAGQCLAAVERAQGGWRWQPVGPRPVRLRVLEQILADLGTSTPRGSECARWLATLEAGGVATLGGVRGDGRSGHAGHWIFTRAPAPRGSALPTATRPDPGQM